MTFPWRPRTFPDPNRAQLGRTEPSPKRGFPALEPQGAGQHPGAGDLTLPPPPLPRRLHAAQPPDEMTGTKAQRFPAAPERRSAIKAAERRVATAGAAREGGGRVRGRLGRCPLPLPRPRQRGPTPGAISRFHGDPISIGKWLSCSTPFSPMLTD